MHWILYRILYKILENRDRQHFAREIHRFHHFHLSRDARKPVFFHLSRDARKPVFEVSDQV